MADAHKNFAYSTVLTAPSPATSGTSLVVQSTDGTKYPAVPFNATVWPAVTQPTTANAEVVRVTAISTDTLTIVRAQESSVARTIVVGDQIAATITNKSFTDIEPLSPTAVKTATTYTAAEQDFIPCDTTSNSITITLPNAPADKTMVGVKHVIQGSTNTVTINCAGSDVFNKAGGVTTASLPVLAEGYLFQYKKSTAIWYIVAHDSPRSAAYFEALAALSPASLTALQAQAVVQAAQIQAQQQANLGYFVAQGCVYTPNGTPTKLDVTAGTIFNGGVEITVPAVTAISTTIASLADATNPKWVVVELDTSGVTQFNQGTAAAVPAVPTIPSTSSRTPVGLLYVPANATNVDALLTTANGLAKFIDIRIVKPGQLPNGWQYEQGTFVFGFAGSSTQYGFLGITGDRAAAYPVGTKISWNDATNVPGYGVLSVGAIASPANTGVASNVATNQFTKTAHGYSNIGFHCVVVSGLANTTGITNGTLYWVKYVDANTFTLATSVNGTAIDITGSADSSIILSPATTLLTIQNGDYAIANHAITAPRFSNAYSPAGFPAKFSWTPTTVGWSAAGGAVYEWWCPAPGVITISIGQNSGTWTSNSATKTVSLPVTATAVTDGIWGSMGYGIVASTATAGLIQVTTGGATATMVMPVTANASSGTWRFIGEVTYPFS